MTEYSTVALKPDVREKLDVWQDALRVRWGWQPTLSQTVDWLIDNAGVPQEVNDG
jgi:hypothetical protein